MNYLELLDKIKKTLPDRRKTKRLVRKMWKKGLVEKKIQDIIITDNLNDDKLWKTI
jgi:hypothetical protein